MKSRRSVMKGVSGLSATGVTLWHGSVSSSAENMASEWECESDCPEENIFVGTIPNAQYSEARVPIHWFGSEYLGGSVGWQHELSISIGAASNTRYDQLQGHRYKIQGPDGEILPETNNNRHGSYPDGSSGTILSWAEPLMATAVGTLSAGASWFIAAGNRLRQEMGPAPDGFDFSIPDGFAFKNTNGRFFTWKQCCCYHRVKYQSDLYRPKLELMGGISEYQNPLTGGCRWKKTEFTMEDYVVPSSSNPTRLSASEKSDLGIKKVPDSSDLTRTIDGEEVEVKYIATECPFQNVTVDHTVGWD